MAVVADTGPVVERGAEFSTARGETTARRVSVSPSVRGGAAGTPATDGLAARVERALPGLIDAGVLPDRVVAMDELPRAGRSRKLDRTRLTELLS